MPKEEPERSRRREKGLGDEGTEQLGYPPFSLAGRRGERTSISIRQEYANLTEEGIAFYTYDADADIGVDIYRLQNSQQPGSYLFVGEEAKNNILANYAEYTLEGVAFEVLI
jgi:hypothetical protein